MEISVVVPSHDRPQRLRALLDALAAQSLRAGRWEAVVVHDDGPGPTEDLLRDHPLAAAGVLRHRSVAPGTGSAARMRNVGWRAAGGRLIAFTDDDCRPHPDWLERLLAATARKAGAIVQGRTRPDPAEAALLAGASRASTRDVAPPTPFGETCNIAYPRALLAALDGFHEGSALPFGEDMDLLLRARRAGAVLQAAPDAVVDARRRAADARPAPALVGPARADAARGRPQPRGAPLHRAALPQLPGQPARVAPARRCRPGARASAGAPLLALPWLRHAARRRRARAARGATRLRVLGEAVVTDAVDLAYLARGSARHRTLWL